MAIPTIVIGLGGLGFQVVSEIKRRLVESHDGRLPSEIRLLAVDTDSEMRSEHPYPALEPQEYCYIGGDLFAFATDVATGQHAEVSSWFASNHYLRVLPRAGFNVSQGSGQSRQFARLALFREVAVPSDSTFYFRLRQAIGTCLQAGSSERLQVMLISSLAGGTGTGMLLDIAYLARTIATEEFRSRGILVQGFAVFPEAFLGTVPGTFTIPLAHARAFAVMRELSRFQTRLNWDIGYPVHYHDRGPDSIWRSRAMTRLFDHLYFVDAGREQHSFVHTPLRYGIVPLVANAIIFALDKHAGRILAERKYNLAASSTDIAERDTQTVAPMGGTFSAFSIELPIRSMVEGWSHRLALEALDGLFTSSARVADSGAPASLKPDANPEAGLGIPGRDEVWSFLNADRVIGPLGEAEMSPLMAKVGSISGWKLDRSERVRELADLNPRDWIRILEIESVGRESTPIRQQLDFTLKSARLSDLIRTGKQPREDPRWGSQRIEQEIVQCRMRLLGQKLDIGAHKGGGLIQKVFGGLQRIHLTQFRRALLIQVDRILNGVSEDPRRAKVGKVGYALDFLDGLHSTIDTTVSILDQTRRLKESEHQVNRLTVEAELARQRMKEYAERKLFGLVNRGAFRAQERYIRAEEALIEVEFSRIALSSLIRTLHTMQQCVITCRQSLASWVEALAFGRQGLYARILDEIQQLRHERESEKRSVSRLVLYDEEYEAARYDFYEQSGMGLARLLSSFRWVVDLQTRVDERGAEVSVRIGSEVLSLDWPDYGLQTLLELSRETFLEAADSESIVSLLMSKYPPREVSDILLQASEPVMQLRAVPQPTCATASSYYLGVQVGDAQQSNYVEHILNDLSRMIGLPERSMQLVGLEDRNKCMFVVYEEPIDLAQSDAYSNAAQKYHDLQASKRIEGRLVHVFPAEVNAVTYEQRLLSELQQPYRAFHPRVVGLLEYPERIVLFARACIYRLIEAVQGENGHSFVQLQLPADKPVALQTHTGQTALESFVNEHADWLEALQVFIFGAAVRGDYVKVPIDRTRVEKACAQVQQEIRGLDEFAVWAERFLSQVVVPLEKSKGSLLNRDLGSLLHLIVIDEIQNTKRLGPLGPVFFSLWDNLDVVDFYQRVQAFCTYLSQASALPLVEAEAADEDLILFAIDARHAFKDITLPFPILPIIFIRKHRLAQDDPDRIRRLITSSIGTPCKVALLVVFAAQDDLREVKRLISGTMKQAYAYDIICPSLSELQSVVVAEQGRDALRQLVLSQIDLTTVSPFVVTGSTPDDMFFGREKELREITESAATTSFLLVGGRRFGKTSLLKRLEGVRLLAAGFQALYHDCSFTPTQAEFVQAVSANKAWFPEPLASLPDSFAEIIQALPDVKPLVILLDEADHLVRVDRQAGYPLFRTLRAMVNMGRCRFVLSGERTLHTDMMDPNSPLYNFGNEILIGRLDFRAVEELVTRPMKHLEIELASGVQMVQRIWEFTSGHPNVVQRFCKRLIVRLNQRGDRHLTLDDVEAVAANPDFLRKGFLNIYWERATTLERLCSLVMAKNDNVRTLMAVHKAMLGCGAEATLNEVDDALERLVDLRNILQRTPEGYRFAVTAFPEVIAKTARLDDWIARNRETYQRYGDVEPPKRGAP